MTTNFAYGYKDPGVGTKQDAYITDQNGDLKLAYSLTLKTLNSNSRGFTSEIVWTDDASGTEYKTQYGFGECN